MKASLAFSMRALLRPKMPMRETPAAARPRVMYEPTPLPAPVTKALLPASERPGRVGERAAYGFVWFVTNDAIVWS